MHIILPGINKYYQVSSTNDMLYITCTAYFIGFTIHIYIYPIVHKAFSSIQARYILHNRYYLLHVSDVITGLVSQVMYYVMCCAS